MYSLIIGAGFSGRWIAEALNAHGGVVGTRRTQEAVDSLGFDGVVFDASELSSTLPSGVTDKVTHLVVSVAPGREPPLNEPVLSWIARHDIESKPLFPKLRWLGYLSTIGVYGDHGGDWVDEDSPCISTQPRSIMRKEAEAAWQAFASARSLPLSVLRLSGIYGPGRNAVHDALKGRDRMIIKPAQVFNRIHVADLATATSLCALASYDGVLNITDDEPAPPQDVIRFAHALVGKNAPPEVRFDEAELSPMARSFYSENKRVDNRRSKEVLGLDYQYPNYRLGLQAVQ